MMLLLLRLAAAQFSYRVIAKHAALNDQQLRGEAECSLSPTFRAGELVFFIPWRVVAEESGAAHFDPLGLAGGADFRFGSGSGRRWSSGIGRPTMPWPARRAYRVTH